MYLPPYLSLWPAAQDSRCFWHSGCPRIQGQGGSLQPVDPMYQQIIPLLICAFYNFPWYFPHGQVLHNGCLWANSLLLFFYFWPHSRQLNIPWPGVKPTPQQWPDSQQWQPKILNPLSHQGTLGQQGAPSHFISGALVGRHSLVCGIYIVFLLDEGEIGFC